MKILNEIGIIGERVFHDKLNIQKIKDKKASNEIINDNCTRNKKINNVTKNIDEKRRIELKNDKLIRDIITIKNTKEKKTEKNINCIYSNISFQIIISIMKFNFNDLKMDLVNTENSKEHRYLKYLKIFKLKERQKHKRKYNII